MFSHNIENQPASKSKLRRFKSQNQVISHTKNIDLLITSPSKLSKHGGGSSKSKSKSKSKLIENKLFASAKRVDDKATLLTSSTLTESHNNKMSNLFTSSVTRSVNKKSSLNPSNNNFNNNNNKIRIKNTTSQ